MAVQFVRIGAEFFDLFGQRPAANQNCSIHQFNEVQMTFLDPMINFPAAALA